MRVDNPCDWIIERLRAGKPFFSIRVNDGEMTCMYRACEEGKVLGTDANPQTADWAMGDALREMLTEINAHPRYDDVLVGHCCHDDPDNELNKRFMEEFGTRLEVLPEAGGHWPLDGVVDGSTRRMLEVVGERGCTLVTCDTLRRAQHCLLAGFVEVPVNESWAEHEKTEKFLEWLLGAIPHLTLVWAAGAGLKPTAWRLFKKFPRSSHIDVGHLFNGALGLRDYGWLQRQDGPWWEPYFRPGGFADWVRSFAP